MACLRTRLGCCSPVNSPLGRNCSGTLGRIVSTSSGAGFLRHSPRGPGRIVTLRQKARLLADSRRSGTSPCTHKSRVVSSGWSMSGLPSHYWVFVEPRRLGSGPINLAFSIRHQLPKGHRSRNRPPTATLRQFQSLTEDATNGRIRPKADRSSHPTFIYVVICSEPTHLLWFDTTTASSFSLVPAALHRSAASSMNALTRGERCRLLGYTTYRPPTGVV
jgi:hypothetical protein